MEKIEQQELKKILSYDPETGFFSWKATRALRVKNGDGAGWSEPGRYVRINIAGKLYYAHRLAFLYMTGAFPKCDVDHINGKKSDNRWCNLRHAMRSQNIHNKKYPLGRSGFRGVCWSEDKQKFRAKIQCNGKIKFCGDFTTAEQAHRAYAAASKKLYGEFSKTT